MKEEERKRRLEEKMARALREEKERRLMQEAPKDLAIPNSQNDEKNECQIVCEQNEHWKKIVANYKKEFPEEQVSNNNSLSFRSTQSAEDFFTKQAKKGYEFHGTWVVDGKRTDEHLYSCGNGEMYKGSLAAIYEALQEALTTEANPEKKAMLSKGIEHIKSCMPKEQNPAVEMRNKLQESKKTGDDPENISTQTEELKEEQEEKNTPLATLPNPFK